MACPRDNYSTQNAATARPLWQCFVCVAVMLVPLTGSADEVDARHAQLQHFETHVRPILHARCVKCHGENQQQGELRLDSLEGLLMGGDSGPAAKPGKVDESLLLEAVRYESFEMPPDKPLSDKEIAHLERWIADGAAWPTHEGKSVRLSGAMFTDEELNFWSLQPIAHPAPPVTQRDWGVNEIDQFVGAKLEAAGITAAAQASDDVLIRRLYFDVLGLPPSPSDVADFLANDSPDRWNQLIDRLLADTRYGEHWARYWLDIVRYAESDGFRADFYRPDAWRYRDYVVNAFNNDKPYDQFVTEQLAGDEVAPEKAEALVATGFLRTYLYEYNQRDARTQWQDILNQTTDVTGEAFLGLGVGCARCHDHKFDPILQEDYFRLQACFGTMMPRDDVPAADLTDRQQYEEQYQAWLKKGADLRQQLDAIRGPYLERAAKAAVERFPEDVKSIMDKSPQDWTHLEAQLADLMNRQVLYDQARMKIKKEDQERIDELEKQIAEVAGREPQKLPSAITVADNGPTPQPIHIGGNPERKVVPPGGLTIIKTVAFKVPELESSTGQRTALAKWITSPENPLTARVIVNRIWQRHFGTGLVATASDFGTLGGRPSHPQLLDWLASEFVNHGWSIKWLHRKILTSATWRMSAFHPNVASVERIDPGNELRWRFNIRRLNAEQIRDAILTASGELKSEQGGPSVDHNSLRRSLYLKAIRNKPEPLMRSLDGVDGLNSIPKRSTTTTPTQALNLMNGDWLRTRSEAMARRVLDVTASDDLKAAADLAFRIALGRTVDSEETSVAVKLISDATESTSRVDNALEGSLAGSGAGVHIGDDGLPPLSTPTFEPAVNPPFTFAAIFQLNSLYQDATVRTLISQWDSSNKRAGWAIGVTSERSAFKPRNLILQVVSDKGYEVVASNLRPELNKPFFVAVTVEQADAGNGRATFYLQSLSKPAAESRPGELQTATVDFKSAREIMGQFPIVLGGRFKQAQHRWDGQLDQVALIPNVLSADDIQLLSVRRLATKALLPHSPLAVWDFDNEHSRLVDVTAHRHVLTTETKLTLNPIEKGVAELCHVLLNSNEFVYVD